MKGNRPQNVTRCSFADPERRAWSYFTPKLDVYRTVFSMFQSEIVLELALRAIIFVSKKTGGTGRRFRTKLMPCPTGRQKNGSKLMSMEILSADLCDIEARYCWVLEGFRSGTKYKTEAIAPVTGNLY